MIDAPIRRFAVPSDQQIGACVVQNLLLEFRSDVSVVIVLEVDEWDVRRKAVLRNGLFEKTVAPQHIRLIPVHLTEVRGHVIGAVQSLIDADPQYGELILTALIDFLPAIGEVIHLPSVHLAALLDGRGACFHFLSGHHLADDNADM